MPTIPKEAIKLIPLEVADPSAGGGVDVSEGLFGRATDGSLWFKNGAGATAWCPVLDADGKVVFELATTEDAESGTGTGVMTSDLTAAAIDALSALRPRPLVLPKTHSVLRNIDAFQVSGVFNFVAVGDSMAAHMPDAMWDFIQARYGLRGGALNGLSRRTTGDVVKSSWFGGAGPVDFTLWETGEISDIGVNGALELGMIDGLGLTAGYVVSDKITVYAIARNGGGTFKVQTSPDGSTWTDVAALTDVDTDDATGPKALIVSGTAPLAYQRWRVIGLTGRCWVIGAKIERASASGAIYTKIARGGLQIAQSNQVLPAIFDPIIADLNPTLVVFEQKDSLSDYANHLPTYLDRWSAAGVNPDFVLVGTTDSAPNNGALIRASLRDIAADYTAQGVVYWDKNAAIGGWDGITRMGWESGDAVHLQQAAHEAAAGVFIRDAALSETGRQISCRQHVSSGASHTYEFGGYAPNAAGPSIYLFRAGPNNRASLTLSRRFVGIGQAISWALSLNENGTYSVVGGNVNSTKTSWSLDGRLTFGTNISIQDDSRIYAEEFSVARHVITAKHTNANPTGKLIRALDSTNALAFEVDHLGNITSGKAGGGLRIKEGTNARMGVATLVAGEVVVSTTAVTANSRIFLTSQADGGTPGWLRVSARTAGASFTITSSEAADTSTVAWMIVEPAP